jgi:uncharacterized membrane protein
MALTFHVYFGEGALTAPPKLKPIRQGDCFAALAEGLSDAMEAPTYPAFLGLFYALAGVTLVSVSSFADALHLVFPLASGFALIGPIFAIGLFEINRRRELGLAASWRDAFAALRSPALPSILALGLLLLAIFAAWIAAAQFLYLRVHGPEAPAAVIPFLRDALTSGRGIVLVVLGSAVGFCFAAAAISISVISFPLMLDRDVGLVPAIGASLKLSRECPAAVALWGLIVAAGLVLGGLTLFVGLAVVMPVFGHSAWRLYRLAVEREARIKQPVEQSRAGRRGRQNPRPSSKTARNAQDQADDRWRSRFT